MELAVEKTAKRRRLAPDARRAQIVSLAASAALSRGNLPIPLGALAEAAGVSKPLVYAYFPTQHDLFDAVLAAEFEAMARAGLTPAAAAADLNEAAQACAAIYFEHVAARGAVAHLILRDPYMRGRVSAENRAFRDRIARPLARAARRRLGLRPHEAVAAFNMAVTIPEEAGLLVHSGETDRDVGRDLVAQIVESTLAALAGEADAGRAQTVDEGR